MFNAHKCSMYNSNCSMTTKMQKTTSLQVTGSDGWFDSVWILVKSQVMYRQCYSPWQSMADTEGSQHVSLVFLPWILEIGIRL